MRKKIIAFYDVLLLAVICGPLMICSISIFVFGKLHDLEWTLKYWYLVILFAIGIMLPIGCSLMIRYVSMNDKNSIYFHYFPFTTSWKKAANNIDVKWNQNVFISEIKDIEIVKLTEEEKQTKVYYKHWFNKYLKINLKYGGVKYVYVGHFSNFQINKIIRLVTMKNQTKSYV